MSEICLTLKVKRRQMSFKEQKIREDLKQLSCTSKYDEYDKLNNEHEKLIRSIIEHFVIVSYMITVCNKSNKKCFDCVRIYKKYKEMSM